MFPLGFYELTSCFYTDIVRLLTIFLGTKPFCCRFNITLVDNRSKFYREMRNCSLFMLWADKFSSFMRAMIARLLMNYWSKTGIITDTFEEDIVDIISNTNFD